MARIVKSAFYDADIEAIWLSIARRHPATAASVIERIEASIEIAGQYPKIGTPSRISASAYGASSRGRT